MRIFKRRKGFTLVEVVIAVAITAIVATAIYNVWDHLNSAYTTQKRESQAKSDANQAVNAILTKMRQNDQINASVALIGTTGINMGSSGSIVWDPLTHEIKCNGAIIANDIKKLEVESSGTNTIKITVTTSYIKLPSKKSEDIVVDGQYTKKSSSSTTY